MKWGMIAVVAAVMVAGCATREQPRDPGADLILQGGRIWTGNAEEPWAEAVAISQNRIVALGDSRAVLRHSGRRTEVISLGGRLVLPGFIDSHVHLMDGGAEILAPDLRTARSARELGERLGTAARALPDGTWLTAGSWDHENWPGAPLPTRADLDPFTPRHPVFVSRLDGHMAVANSLALKLAGVTRSTVDPPGGVIVRDAASGEPTGVLKDAAMDLVATHVPPPTREQLFARARAAMDLALSQGVTGMHDMGPGRDAIEVYRALRDSGEMKVRITVYLPIGAQTPVEARDLRTASTDFIWLKITGVKSFADGSLGSSTALFQEPYADQPANRGLALADLSANGVLERQIVAFCGELFQPAIHAIGDRANTEALDLLRRVDREASHPFHPPFREFRIEHAQHLNPNDVGRFGRYGVIACMQPYHAIDDGRWCEKRIGAPRCQTTYAFRSLLDQGATLAFGSDWPVAPLSPLLGIYAATTRRTLDGQHPEGWIPAQKIAVEEAIRAFTQGSARAGLAPRESGLGTILVGGLADLCVLDRDLFTIDPAEIREARVDLTVVNGQVVYQRK